MVAQDGAAERSFKILGVDHVAITAPEELEEDVVRWYSECLGLERIEKPEGARVRGAWFRVGEQQIHVQVDEHNPPKTAHVGLVVDDHETLIERLRDAKCHIEQAGLIPGRHRFFTRDPAGNRLEILAFEEQPATIEYEEAE